MPDRKHNMQVWLNSLGYDLNTLTVASEDASFRRYFRIEKEGQSYIVMDAPPENEPCGPFVTLATRLTAHNVNAPEIYAQNMEEGYLVLSDFGDDLLLGLLNDNTVEDLYGDAMATILHMQQHMPKNDIPMYSAKLLYTEMELFKEWFIEKLLGLSLNDQQEALWQQAKDALVQSALDQPQVFVHRDFHSRNLIKTPTSHIALIDFQDAVDGAMTYDLVSLLRDCYIDWPEEDVDRWVTSFYAQANEKNELNVSYKQFKSWFNLMGTQRHLKAIGIFSRLKIRDNKHGYIADIPRTLSYIEQVSTVEESMYGLGLIISELSLIKKVNALIGD